MIDYCYEIRDENHDQAVVEIGAPDEAKITDLVKQAANGGFEAFGKLYGIYLDRIYQYVFYQVKDQKTAEELTEEVFLKVWWDIGSYRSNGDGLSFSAWLYRIAHKHIIDNISTRQRHVPLDLEASLNVADPNGGAEILLTQEEVSELLSCLSPQQGQIIILKFIEGLGNSEIAKVTGKSQDAIRIMQMSALATLQRRLIKER